MQYYSGMDYLRIDVAGQFGLDKELFETRIQWVHDNESQLESLEDQADDFFRYAAALSAYRLAQQGIPTGHLVGMDACASGAQILSILTGCLAGSANAGVTGKSRMDVYSVLTEVMNKTLASSTSYDRSVVKDAFMTMLYGSKKQPKEAFGIDTPELAAFYQAADIVCPGAVALLHIIMSLWDDKALSYRWDLPDGFVSINKVKTMVDHRIHVDTLDHEPTFEYRHKVNEPIESGKVGSQFLPADITHSCDGYIVRELCARCNHNPGALRSAELLLIKRLQRTDTDTPVSLYIEQMWHKHGCLSIEGAEWVNGWSVNQMSKEYSSALLALIRKTLKNPSFEVVSIHDEFKCLPNHMNQVRQCYTDILCEMADSTILDAILSDVAGKPMHVEKLSNDLSKWVKDSEYNIA